MKPGRHSQTSWRAARGAPPRAPARTAAPGPPPTRRPARAPPAAAAPPSPTRHCRPAAASALGPCARPRCCRSMTMSERFNTVRRRPAQPWYTGRGNLLCLPDQQQLSTCRQRLQLRAPPRGPLPRIAASPSAGRTSMPSAPSGAPAQARRASLATKCTHVPCSTLKQPQHAEVTAKECTATTCAAAGSASPPPASSAAIDATSTDKLEDSASSNRLRDTGASCLKPLRIGGSCKANAWTVHCNPARSVTQDRG